MLPVIDPVASLSMAYGAVRYKDPEDTFDHVIQRLATRKPELDLQQYANYHMLQVYFEGLGLLVKNGRTRAST
jgi:hypothetical protein